MLRLSRQLTCHGNHSRKQIVSCCRTVISGQTYSTSPSILTISQTEVARKKHAVRGGQNLSSRYDRLEKSLRGKEGYDQRIADLKEEGSSLSSSGQTASVKKNTFMGFVIPEKPKPPADDECCMSGCAVCVYDLYDEALHDYNDKLSSLRTSLQVLNIPEFQWPLAVRTAPVDKVTDSKKSPTLSAFEELELRLKQKQEESLVSPPDHFLSPSESIASHKTSRTALLPNGLDAVVETTPISASLVAQGVPFLAADAQLPEEQVVRVVRRRGRRKKTVVPDAGSLYEGIRWLLFSNR